MHCTKFQCILATRWDPGTHAAVSYPPPQTMASCASTAAASSSVRSYDHTSEYAKAIFRSNIFFFNGSNLLETYQVKQAVAYVV